ncbi:MAG: N-acetyl-gamma-glutamyl-phosphate reductase, partial [Actinobacteria bacterium]|nr:N-acetyl-gamma-glutamyl-phosphate reductase [Actinomycetota bacterium]
VHPQLQSYAGKKFNAFSPNDFASCDLIFLALPHGESAKVIAQLPTTAKIVDLGADYRLESSEAWTAFYGGDYAGAWTYGLADIEPFKSLVSKSTKVANPGCYATSIALGAAPASEIADMTDVVVVAASGTTGAGRSAKINLLASEVAGSLTSYKFGGVHQHTPEIEQALTKVSGVDAKISFTPILAPMPRGILSTITAKLTKKISTEQAHALYSSYFAKSQFVTVLPIGVMPKTAALTGSNHVQIQVAVDEHTSRLIISVAIDNLGKGAAAQAIQNANLMCGLDEAAGLNFDGLGV